MRSFLDTNVLVYADAADVPTKQRRAIDLIAQHCRDGTGVVSTQVLQEFANVALRKLGMPVALVQERLGFYSRFDVVATSPDLISSAVDLHATHQVSFYDALIVRAAVAAGCAQLLSEDLQAGRAFNGLVIRNPFQIQDPA